MTRALDALAKRVEGDPFFLASLLRIYASSEGLDDTALASALGCRHEVLTGLRLCRAPRPEPAEFREDVARIARHFGVDEGRLIGVVRRGQALQALAAAPAGTRGVLLAARDAESPDGEASPGGKA